MINYIYVDRGGHKRARLIKNRKEYFAIRNTATNLRHFEAARAGDKKAKMRLRQFNYNDLLPDGVLKGCRHPASTFAHDIDCGREELCREIAQTLLAKKEEIGLLELSVSSGWGLHAVCRREPGKTILENQVRVAMLTETEMDTSAHDQQRVMFTGPATEDVLLYLDDAIFDEPLSVEASSAEYQRLKERERRGEEEVPPEAKKANKHLKPWDSSPESGEDRRGLNKSSSKNSGGEIISFKGRPYSDIIAAWWQRQGGEPQEGERNVKLYQLAVNLRAICDNSPQRLMQVMPRFGLDEEELRNIVESACKEPPKGISKMLGSILSEKLKVNSEKLDQTLGGENSPLSTLNSQLNDWGDEIESLFNDFPLLRDICKGLKRNQYPAALVVGGGFLMTLMTRCAYRFYHRPEELRRLNCSALIIGDPASGKSFATRLYKLLMAPVFEADKVGKDAINAYREEMRTKGANKEKPKKPRVVIRIHPARTSNAQFIQDMVNAVEIVDGEPMHLHMLTFDTELDNTVTVQKGGSWIDKQSLELKAFHNEEDGQAYSNNDSIFQDFNVYWNFIYTGTPIALKKKVNEQNFGSGLATRLTVVPLPATNFQMLTRERIVDLESDERLKTWAAKLDKTKGLLPFDHLVDELYDWTSRRMADAEENDSKADEMLLKRCAYHGLNFAAPFIVMRHWEQLHQDGDYWTGEFETDETDWKLAELIVSMQYACQRHYFGAMAEAYFDNRNREAATNVRHQQKTLEAFGRLPDEFTVDDVMRCFGLTNIKAARSRSFRLLKDGLAEKSGEFVDNGTTKARYRKTGKLAV